MAEMDENEGMSTGKKVAAGAALGVAVPAAVAVGKKLLAGDEEGGDSRGQAQSNSGGRGSPQRTRATSKRARSTGSRISWIPPSGMPESFSTMPRASRVSWSRRFTISG